jgi:hypothetical protein
VTTSDAWLCTQSFLIENSKAQLQGHDVFICCHWCAQNKRSFPRFVVKEMESAYVDELKASINLLMANLESLPVTKGNGTESKYSLQKFKRYNK